LSDIIDLTYLSRSIGQIPFQFCSIVLPREANFQRRSDCCSLLHFVDCLSAHARPREALRGAWYQWAHLSLSARRTCRCQLSDFCHFGRSYSEPQPSTGRRRNSQSKTVIFTLFQQASEATKSGSGPGGSEVRILSLRPLVNPIRLIRLDHNFDGPQNAPQNWDHWDYPLQTRRIRTPFSGYSCLRNGCIVR
jgi:hypothetical protein